MIWKFLFFCCYKFWIFGIFGSFLFVRSFIPPRAFNKLRALCPIFYHFFFLDFLSFSFFFLSYLSLFFYFLSFPPLLCTEVRNKYRFLCRSSSTRLRIFVPFLTRIEFRISGSSSSVFLSPIIRMIFFLFFSNFLAILLFGEPAGPEVRRCVFIAQKGTSTKLNRYH